MKTWRKTFAETTKKYKQQSLYEIDRINGIYKGELKGTKPHGIGVLENKEIRVEA